jgi:hypothetical protein
VWWCNKQAEWNLHECGGSGGKVGGAAGCDVVRCQMGTWQGMLMLMLVRSCRVTKQLGCTLWRLPDSG